MNPAGTFADKGGSLVFPHQNEAIKHFALDIGGSLLKLVYFKTSSDIAAEDPSTAGKFIGGKLHFIKFETRRIEECIEFIKTHDLLDQSRIIKVTGGGAYKYADLFRKHLNAEFERVDEMESLITGTNFLLANVPNESFTFVPEEPSESPPAHSGNKSFCPIGHEYPYLLVIVGSGVSIVRVDGDTEFKRIDGTSLGGGTFWGLCNMITGVEDFDEMLCLSLKGDNTRIDLTVGDIYGQDYGKVGLPSHIIASTFGKVIYEREKERRKSNPPAQAASSTTPSSSSEPWQWRKEDATASLLKMICNNIAQIAYHNAMRHNIKRIYFGGFFIRNHKPTMNGISMGIKYWSQGSIQALFLLHEGYLGSLGAFLKGELKPAEPSSRAAVTLPPKAEWANFLNIAWSMDPTPERGVPERTRPAPVCDCGCDFCEGIVCRQKENR